MATEQPYRQRTQYLTPPAWELKLNISKKLPRGHFWVANRLAILWIKKTARNKQIVFFAESRKTVKLKLFLEKAKKGHSGELLDIK